MLLSIRNGRNGTVSWALASETNSQKAHQHRCDGIAVGLQDGTEVMWYLCAVEKYIVRWTRYVRNVVQRERNVAAIDKMRMSAQPFLTPSWLFRQIEFIGRAISLGIFGDSSSKTF